MKYDKVTSHTKMLHKIQKKISGSVVDTSIVFGEEWTSNRGSKYRYYTTHNLVIDVTDSVNENVSFDIYSDVDISLFTGGALTCDIQIIEM